MLGITCGKSDEVIIAGVDAEQEVDRPRIVIEMDQSRVELQFDKFARSMFTMGEKTNHLRSNEIDIRDTVEDTNARVLWYKIAGFIGIALVSLGQIMYTRNLFEKRYSY